VLHSQRSIEARRDTQARSTENARWRCSRVTRK